MAEGVFFGVCGMVILTLALWFGSLNEESRIKKECEMFGATQLVKTKFDCHQALSR